MRAPVIKVPARFSGVAGMAHGGYVAGLLARHLGDAVEVVFRRPVPLDTDLTLDRTTDGIAISDGGRVLADARVGRPASVELPLVTIREARAATARYRGHDQAHDDACFACGPARALGDGLRVFPGRLDGSTALAASWVPPRDAVRPDRTLDPAWVWPAIDCASAWAVVEAGLWDPGFRVVSGTLRAAALAPIPDTELVVVAKALERTGRRIRSAGVVHDGSGVPLAALEQVLVQLDVPLPEGRYQPGALT